MIIQLLILVLTGDLVLTLQCKTAKESKCRWNSTCEYGLEECHQTSRDLRGGVYCTTLIYSLEDVFIESMGCMYDQETTKTCQNQTQCLMKYTNSQKKFLHCCCDKDFCNLNLNLSDPVIHLNSPSTSITANCSNVDWFCKYNFSWKKSSILSVLSMFIVVIVLIIFISILISQWNSIKRFFSRLMHKTKTGSSTSKSKDNPTTDDPICSNENLLQQIPLINENNDQSDRLIDFNQLTISSKPLKQGKFSQIYSGFYRDQQVAIKCFKENSSQPSIHSMFDHEKHVYLLPQMNHENILKFFGYSMNKTNYYLIFDYADCGSLRDYLRLNLIKDENELIAMLRQIGDGIEYLHRDFRPKSSHLDLTRSSLAHRDMKTDNILRYSNGNLVICDLAMSIVIDEEHLSTSDHQQIGTARYMAPEILAGTIGNDFNALLRCDVYAVGLIFWEIVSRLSTLEERHERYLMPYEEQLLDKNFNRNPSVEEMLQIVNLESPFNRPLIPSSWRKSNRINEILLTIEQCWHSTPEGRINASLVAHRIRQIK